MPSTITDAVTTILQAAGTPDGELLADTPRRVINAWSERLSGYRENPAEHLRKTFPAPDSPSLITVSGIRLQSTCAHHLLPITGTVTIAYRPKPGGRIVGLSKLSRCAEGFARRLQVQEQITAQIIGAMQAELDPIWVAVAVVADHDCMRLRGVRDPDAKTTTFTQQGTPLPGDMEAFWAAQRNQ